MFHSSLPASPPQEAPTPSFHLTSCPDYCPMAEGVGPHLLLELAELGREAVDANAGLLQLLVGSPHQVAVPLSCLPGVIQLEGRTQG